MKLEEFLLEIKLNNINNKKTNNNKKSIDKKNKTFIYQIQIFNIFTLLFLLSFILIYFENLDFYELDDINY